MEPTNLDGSPPDKLFRCKNIEDKEGLNSSAGMVPLNLFMLKSRYTNSESDCRLLSGPVKRLSDSAT